MKLYAFLGQSWGLNSFYVMAENEDNAIKALFNSKDEEIIDSVKGIAHKLKDTTFYKIKVLNENEPISQEIA
jgi:hypothetical protein